MLVDMHCHTSGISRCCVASCEEVFKIAKEKGYDGLVITNHYVCSYFDESSFNEWIEKYVEEWKKCKTVAKKYGLKSFDGVELTPDFEPRLHLLIYGADEKFLRENKFLNRKSLKEIYALCKKNNYALIQAHPRRYGLEPIDLNLVDGVEINCHPNHFNGLPKEMVSIAKENNFAITCGCDYHADTYRPFGGTFLPDEIKNEKDLAEYILNNKVFNLQIQEPNADEVYKLEVKIDDNK